MALAPRPIAGHPAPASREPLPTPSPIWAATRSRAASSQVTPFGLPVAADSTEADGHLPAVPGMHGGFHHRLVGEGGGARLVTESWCRVVGGSGQRHEIHSSGRRLVAEGFV
jgi:hypothetical protein